MDMSKAALPARYGHASAADRAHPLFSLYQQYRSSMSMLMVDSSDFRDWLANYTHQQMLDDVARDPQFPAFQAWMREEKAGGRKCPVGVFPHNFRYWQAGGRW